jgi:hypothetical protein
VRKVKAILLLVILVINASGFYVYYAVQLQMIHNEMRRALQQKPDKELEILVLTREEFAEARVEEHEVKVDGRMYDIARTRPDGDMIKIFCLHDANEDDLMAFLDEIVSRPIDQTHSMANSAFQFISLIFIIPEEHRSVSTIVFTSQNAARYFFNLIEFCSTPSSPPPWRLM